MLVKKLPENDKARYNSLAVETGRVYWTLPWLALFAGQGNAFGLYEKDGTLRGGFVLFEKRLLGLRYITNPPFTPHIGPFVQPRSMHPVGRRDEIRRAAQAIAEFLDSTGAALVSICLSPEIVDTRPFLWRKFKVSPRYTCVIDLSLAPSDIWQRFTSNVRNHIRRAEDEGLQVAKISDLSIVEEMVRLTHRRRKGPFDLQLAQTILNEFATGTNSFAFATFKDGEPISAIFLIHDHHTCYLVLSGYRGKNPHRGAKAIAIWRAIQYAQKKGLRYFDFEGSMIPSIARYNEGFGGEVRTYFRVTKAYLPLEVLLKLKMREIF